MDNTELNEIFGEYIDFSNKRFREVVDILANSEDFKSIEFTVNTDLSQLDYTDVLYFFEVIDNISAIHICEIIQKEKKEKKKKKKKKDDFKLPLVNFANAKPDNKILYVGKSSGKFTTRLEQHIGNRSKQLYALHLKEWENLFGRKIHLKLHYISFQDYFNKDNKYLLEIIESSLHYKMRPILGRSGH